MNSGAASSGNDDALLSTARATLNRVFGHDGFLPGQARVVSHVLRGESAVAIFPTGGGKSLCYQLPAIMLEGTTLVVSPLKALMKDQVDALRRVGVGAERLDSSLSFEDTERTLQNLREGALDLLYVAPERFTNERFLEALAEAPVALLAVDEAHCISEWGHSFRPDYLKLAEHRDAFGIPQTVALTATATPRVARDVCERFGIPEAHLTRRSTYRANLSLEARAVGADARFKALVEELRRPPQGASVVYVTRRETAEAVAGDLVAAGFDARPFHAGLSDDEKHATQDWFMGTDSGVVVATIAFGMGVDKSDIRRLVHWNPPRSLESYSQQVGRAGRDGEPSRCTLLYHAPDIHRLANYTWGTTPSLATFRDILEDVFARTTVRVSLYEWSVRYGVKETVLRTLLTLLEMEGFLAQGTPTYDEVQFRFLASRGEVRAAASEAERRVLRQVGLAADHKKKWSYLHRSEVEARHGFAWLSATQVLDRLAERGLAEVRGKKLHHPFTRLKEVPDMDALAERLHDHFQAQEDRDLERLRQVPTRFSRGRCLWRVVAEYFGEDLSEDCGHCTACATGGAEPRLPLPTIPPVPEAARGHLDALLEEKPELRGAPLVLARFLTGAWSPALRGHRLYNRDGYRSLECHSLERVAAWVEEEYLGGV